MEPQNKNRCISMGDVGAFALFFSFINIIYDFGSAFGHNWFPKGNVAIDFFFVLGGFGIAKMTAAIPENKDLSAIANNSWKCIKQSVSKFFPYYFSGILLNFVLRKMMVSGESLKSLIRDILRGIPNLSLTFVGIDYTTSKNLYVSGSWFFSAFVIAALLLVPALLYSHKFTGAIISPLVSMFLLGYLNTTFGTVAKASQWLGIAYFAQIRAIAEMCIGISLYYLSFYLLEKYNWFFRTENKAVLLLSTLIKLCVYCTVFAYAAGLNFGDGFSLHALLLISLAALLSFCGMGYCIPIKDAGKSFERVALPVFMFYGTLLNAYIGYFGKSKMSIWQFLLLIFGTIIVCVILGFITRMFVKKPDLSKWTFRIHMLFKYKDLMKLLVQRDIKLKYRRSFLGYLWSVLNPLMSMLVQVVVFTQMFSKKIPNFPVYLICGNILFNFMKESSTQSMNSIVNNAALFKKVYVPKYIFTVSKVTSSFVNMLFSMGALVIVMLITKTPFRLSCLGIVIPVMELYVFCIGLGMILAAGTVFFRDIKNIWSVVTMVWMYLSAIFYDINSLPDTLRTGIIKWNAMYVYIAQMRDYVWNGGWTDSTFIWRGAAMAVGMLILGTTVFAKTKDRFILYI